MLRYTVYGSRLTQHTHTHTHTHIHAPRPHMQEIIKDSLTQTFTLYVLHAS